MFLQSRGKERCKEILNGSVGRKSLEIPDASLEKLLVEFLKVALIKMLKEILGRSMEELLDKFMEDMEISEKISWEVSKKKLDGVSNVISGLILNFWLNSLRNLERNRWKK